MLQAIIEAAGLNKRQSERLKNIILAAYGDDKYKDWTEAKRLEFIQGEAHDAINFAGMLHTRIHKVWKGMLNDK